MNEQVQLIYNDLKDRYISKGLGVLNYKKLGTAKNAKVIFNIIDVSEFLGQTIKTA